MGPGESVSAPRHFNLSNDPTSIPSRIASSSSGDSLATCSTRFQVSPEIPRVSPMASSERRNLSRTCGNLFPATPTASLVFFRLSLHLFNPFLDFWNTLGCQLVDGRDLVCRKMPSPKELPDVGRFQYGETTKERRAGATFQLPQQPNRRMHWRPSGSSGGC